MAEFVGLGGHDPQRHRLGGRVAGEAGQVEGEVVVPGGEAVEVVVGMHEGAQVAQPGGGSEDSGAPDRRRGRGEHVRGRGREEHGKRDTGPASAVGPVDRGENGKQQLEHVRLRRGPRVAHDHGRADEVPEQDRQRTRRHGDAPADGRRPVREEVPVAVGRGGRGGELHERCRELRRRDGR